MIISLSGPPGSDMPIKDAASILGYNAVPEPNNNPFLIPFYRDPHWSFQSQLYFLMGFYKLISLEDAICERNIHESMLIARAQLESEYMQPPEYQLLKSVYEELSPIWPDLIIIIDVPPSVTSSRLLTRQKPSELTQDYGNGMRYLKKLHDLYNSWEPECRSIRISHSDLDRRVVGDPGEKLAEIISGWKDQNMP